MDIGDDDQNFQAYFGREDFAGGIDNDALDFSQLEDFINSDDNGTYFADTLANNEAIKLGMAHGSSTLKSNTGGVVNNRVPSTTPHQSQLLLPPPTQLPSAPLKGIPPSTCSSNGIPITSTTSVYTSLHPHHLPESPPDSGSEPPYSPLDSSHSPHQRANITELLLHPSHLNPPIMHTTLSNTSYGALVYPPNTCGPTTPTLIGPLLPLLPPPISQPQPPGSPYAYTPVVASPTAHPNNNPVTPSPCKKRKNTDSPVGVHVKQEPGSAELSPDSNSPHTSIQIDDEFGYEYAGSDSGMFADPTYQCIRFQSFQENTWCPMVDANLKEMLPPYYKVDADKGFNFSNADDAFVCQKKNHFQITCHVRPHGDPRYVKTSEGFKKIDSFYLHFYGVKVESPTQTIKVEQSQSDRSKKPFNPVVVDLQSEQVSKVTVGRLHFSETTSNNMRKKGKPNPDQRYFHLVVSLQAQCTDSSYSVAAHASQRIIVRVLSRCSPPYWQASNPGQFENDMELCWQKGHTPESVYHAGRVGINTDRPDEALVVYGNVKVTGQILHPSDIRIKEDIKEADTKQQLNHIRNLRLVNFKYKESYASQVGLEDSQLEETGVLAQEVAEIIPEAVAVGGDLHMTNGETINKLLIVDKERIFMENVGAVKELCKVTDQLEERVNGLEKFNTQFSTKMDEFRKGSIAGFNGIINAARSSIRRASSMRSSRHSKKSSSSLPTRSLCTNKFIQIGVLSLIVIIACCLITIATLYFLEWHKRNTQDSYNIVKSVSNSPTTIISVTSGTYDSTSKFPSKSSPKDKTFVSSTPILNTSHPKTQSIPVTTIHPLHLKAQVLGRPINCSSDSNHNKVQFDQVSCQVYCCSSHLPTIQDVATQTSEMRERRHFSAVGNNVEEVTVHSVQRRRVDSSYVQTILNNRYVKSQHKTVKREAGQALGEGMEGTLILTDEHELNPSTRPVQMVKAIKVLGQYFKKTLDYRNCVPEISSFHDCVSGIASDYSYYVPLSKYMPDDYLMLDFVSSSNINLSVVECNAILPSRACPWISKKPIPANEFKNVSNNQVIVEVGVYSAIAYKFRVALYTEEIHDICSLGKDKSGMPVYIQYNFYFYRDCID